MLSCSVFRKHSIANNFKHQEKANFNTTGYIDSYFLVGFISLKTVYGDRLYTLLMGASEVRRIMQYILLVKIFSRMTVCF